MGSVSPISTTQELERFFTCLYGDQYGFVYSPVKRPREDGSWKRHFFLWPQDKDKLINHVQEMSRSYEVYTAPALFKMGGSGSPSGEKVDFIGTNYVWAEFDGNSAEAFKKLPEDLQPAIRVQSSVPGNEHWYWKLENFVTDIGVIEGITQRLAYFLEGDTGCWNANRVLRPPTSTHHESSQRVQVLKHDLTPTPIAAFLQIPEVPVKLIQETDIGTVPAVLDVIAKYKWPEEALTLFKEKELSTKEGKPQGKGFRSAAMAKMGFFCIEMGMTNGEALAILLNVDQRWKKFVNRDDRVDQLLKVINYCRTKKSTKAIEEAVEQEAEGERKEELVSQFKIYNWGEFKEAEVNVDWLIDDYVHKKGFKIVSGPPGVGKTQYSLRFAEAMAKGQPFLKWRCARPIKTLFVSLEMPHEELDYITNVMRIEDPDGALRENFFIMPVGSTIKLAEDSYKNAIASSIDRSLTQIGTDVDVIMIDSLGQAVGDELNSDKVIFDSFQFVHSYIRNQLGAAMWFVHHPRKEQMGNRKPKHQDDLYGSRFISAAATSITNLWPIGKKGQIIEVDCLKLRLASKFDPFNIRRTPGLEFEIAGEVLETTKTEGFFSADDDDNGSTDLINSI